MRQPRIRQLPPHVVNQIAAGEVIERPASVIKELVENALDAGAGQVRIEIAEGGIDLIRVTDDGAGMSGEELPLAASPHATSKIGGVEDLDRIGTMGFRGEALASIASVSRLTMTSRRREDEGGHVLHVDGGRAGAVKPAAGPPGTSVEVRTLFFNTPARRKFLRTANTERTRCLDLVRQVALARADVGFELREGERVLLEVAGGQSPRERVLAVLGEELAGEMVEADADEMTDARGVAIWGLVGLPSIARSSMRFQHVFVNGRAIRDRTIQHAIAEAYRGLIEPGRHPTAVLMLEMDPGAVDVNVHPTKAEVRFRDSGFVHSVVLRAVRDALRRADLTPRLGSGGGRGPGVGGGGPRVSVDRFVEYFKRDLPAAAQGRMSFEAIRQALGDDGGERPEDEDVIEPRAPAPAVPSDSASGPDGSRGPAEGGEEPPDPTAGPFVAAPLGESEFARPRPLSRVLQVHKSFLVTEDDEGVVIIDQHALHERVMFEVLHARITAGPLESQRFLTPVVVEASEGQIDGLEALGELFGRLGIEASPIGPREVAVQAFPSFLLERGVEPGAIVRDLLERAEGEDFAPDGEEAMREVLDMMACKAAVKAGDRLSEEELERLVGLRDEVERSSNCPHGRPTSVRLTIRQLERLFGRT